MDCSEQNFVQSQHFYGLCIAKKAELPSLKASDEDWNTALARLHYLSHISARQQILYNHEQETEAKYG